MKKIKKKKEGKGLNVEGGTWDYFPCVLVYTSHPNHTPTDRERKREEKKERKKEEKEKRRRERKRRKEDYRKERESLESLGSHFKFGTW